MAMRLRGAAPVADVAETEDVFALLAEGIDDPPGREEIVRLERADLRGRGARGLSA
jgi:hypothetical protein